MTTLNEAAKKTGENLCILLEALVSKINELTEENLKLKTELAKLKLEKV